MNLCRNFPGFPLRHQWDRRGCSHPPPPLASPHPLPSSKVGIFLSETSIGTMKVKGTASRNKPKYCKIQIFLGMTVFGPNGFLCQYARRIREKVKNDPSILYSKQSVNSSSMQCRLVRQLQSCYPLFNCYISGMKILF